MYFTSWLAAVQVRLSQIKRRRPPRRLVTTERLEDRTLLSVTSLFIDGELSVASDAGDSISISADPAGNVQVQVNGQVDTSLPSTDASLVQSIIVSGGDEANLIDLRNVDSGDFDFVDASGNGVQVTIEGNDGNDTIYGSTGFGDTIHAGDGQDRVEGRAGDDVINGGDGHDSIFAQEGADTVDGGDGRDLLSGGQGADNLNGADGRDTLDGGNGNDVVMGGDGRDVLHGNDGFDTLNGESGKDTIFGEAGNDSLIGGGAADQLDGGVGDDTLIGQGGSDDLDGGVGNDSLNGGTANDVLFGNTGNDRLNGSAGNDTLEGFSGDDSLFGGGGRDELYGDNSDPTQTGDGNDVLKGQGGNDTLYGGGGADRLEGGDGNDLIDSFLPQQALILVDDVVVSNEGDVASIVTFATDFSSGSPDEFTGFTATETVQGFAGLGTAANVFSGDFLHNDSGCCAGQPSTPQNATRLTLTDLPEHTSVDIDFLLAIINSWEDEADSSVTGPDEFAVTVDGTEIFRENFRNLDGSRQGYVVPPDVALTPSPLSDLGFPGPSGVLERNDAAYDMGLDPTFNAIPHSESSLTVEWIADGGWEGGGNESWGIDNVEVVLNGVPMQTTASFNLSLSKSSGQDVSVDYVTSDGTAVAGTDYVAATGTVIFPAGSTSATVGVTVLGDDIAEANEDFLLTLFNPSNAVIGDTTGQATITDDDAASALAFATAYLDLNATELQLADADIENAIITDHYVSQHTGVTHVFLQQTYGGLDVAGAAMGVHVSDTSEVVALTNRFVPNLGATTPSESEMQPVLSPEETLVGVAGHFGWDFDEDDLPTPDPMGIESLATPQADMATVIEADEIALNEIPFHLEWVPDENGGVELAWNMQIETVDGMHVYQINASTTTGDVLWQNDQVLHFSYRAFEVPVQNPNRGSRTLIVDPQNATASPAGWHDDGTTVFTDTRGNNVLAQEDANQDNAAGNRPDGGGGGVFDFPLDLTKAPSENEDAAITNAFYWMNVAHDIHFHYGFDEAAGNFQTTNTTGQGLGGDAMIVDVLDPSGGIPTGTGPHITVPADGTAPRMELGPNVGPDPDTMAALSNEISVHEYGHGVSIRLVGGPSNASALSNTQGRGMGEGWSDWHALMFNQEITDTATTAKVNGDYYLENTTGVRNYPNTTDMAVNPLTYDDYNGTFPNGSPGNQVHNAGEIFSAALWDMNWLLIARCGFDTDFYTGDGGNNLSMQLVMDGMKLTSVDPSFLDGRDAILQADQVLTGGENAFDIWTAFAGRGMGFSADDGSGNNDTVVEAFDLPADLTDPGDGHSCAAVPPGPGPGPDPGDPGATSPQAPDLVGDTLFGNSGTDTVRGALGDDFINGGGGSDLLEGSGGNDFVYGGASRDTINGGSGNDTLDGQGGLDTIDGNEDDDTLIWRVGNSSDSFSGTEGFDELIVQGTSANNRLTVGESSTGNLSVSDDTYAISAAASVTRVTINAGPGNDRITVGNVLGASGVLLVVNGENGGDTVDASGADLGDVRMLVQGGDGNDTITGSEDDDLLRGENGNDVIDGGGGADTIDGGANHDSLLGGAGADVLSGGADNDSLEGGSGDDLLQGEDGHDLLTGDDGDDTLIGADGDDVLNGSQDDDSLLGNDGADSLFGGTGDDVLDGGVDDDVLSGQAGDDILAGRDGEDRLEAGDGDDIVSGGDGHDTIEGGSGNDLLGGHDGDDRMNAGAGADTLVAGDGHDTLLGGGGADILLGGDGDDFINGNGSTDIVSGNEGMDALGNNLAAEIDEAFELSASILNQLDNV